MIDNNSHYKIITNYLKAINTLFRLKGFPVSVDFPHTSST